MSQYNPLIGFYIDIYVRVSFGGHNLGIFYARKLKLGQLHTYPDINLQLWTRPLGSARGQNVKQVRLSICKIVVAIWAKSKGRGAFVCLDTCLVDYYFSEK